jgi:uncharacterized damage-inducible protein DinB
MRNPLVAQLLDILDRAYDHHSWHGTNLRGSIRRVTPAQAVRRPARGRHNIAELVVHCAYWKYTVVRRLTGEPRGSFTLEGSNFFARRAPYSAALWAADVRLLDDTHRTLREVIAGLSDRRLRRVLRDSDRTTVFDTVAGIAAHDLYHAGQIQVLKRLT